MGIKKAVKKTPKVAAAAPKTVAPLFKAHLQMGDKSFDGEGATLKDALVAMGHPVLVVYYGVLTIEGNGKKLERMFTPFQLRMFLRPSFLSLQAEMLMAAFENV